MAQGTYLNSILDRKQPYIPLSTTSSFEGRYLKASSRWRKVTVMSMTALAILFGVSRFYPLEIPEMLRGRPSNWGLSEGEGWEGLEDLRDLGDEAERVYRLGFEKGLEGTISYFRSLHIFVHTLSSSLKDPLLHSLESHLPPSLLGTSRGEDSYHPQALIDHKTIFQTDATTSTATTNSGTEWSKINAEDGWNVEFYDDEAAHEWVRGTFGGTEILWAWECLKRGVLKADFLRYLLPLIKGGVYADVDVQPHKAIEEWGTKDVEYLSLTGTDGHDWKNTLHRYPAVVVGIDVSVYQKLNWHNDWPRPLGICQWTLGSAPSHPIFIDAARRVVNNTGIVKHWDDWKVTESKRLRMGGDEAGALAVESKDVAEVMSVMEWTGPGLFTDSVMAYLLARYKVTWHRLRGLDHPLRIGDVLILPITSFSPGGEEDFHSGHHWDTQGAVTHHFRGSWKSEGN